MELHGHIDITEKGVRFISLRGSGNNPLRAYKDNMLFALDSAISCLYSYGCKTIEVHTPEHVYEVAGNEKLNWLKKVN
ncbi:hypothetical protein COB55_05835 [Candidatus Wolfebacteria bacterium]|nr:MAG: hypothetical protein COB55_05835 [Candidatus Wolfebacteria bacterium]